MAAALVALAIQGPSAASPKFLDDDPIAREPDPCDASHVQTREIQLSWDLGSFLFGSRADPGAPRAMNLNTIDEVPDSSWFTNRVGSRPLTEADVFRGPDTTTGPAAGNWTVVAGKSEGVRPGFTITDSAGIRWFLKFDLPGHPEINTGAEVVATKLFWAFGYNVAEDRVATLWPKNLVIGGSAMITGANGRHRHLTQGDIDRVLARSERSPDGSYRVLASRQLEGKSLGGFLYYGTRADDPNDIVPHQHRRELRGMRVVAAWVDRSDAKANNTLDTLVPEEGRMVVRHHVLDFGSTLGSAGTGLPKYWEGYEYAFSRFAMLKGFFSFGLPVAAWRTVPYPALRGVGRLASDGFDPQAWKTHVPNEAYVRARPDDLFWAARKVMAISDAMIAAAVRSGEYSDPGARTYLTQTLIKRRDAIGRTYLTMINPIVNPALSASGVLTFENAAVEMADVPQPKSYRATWYRFDNATGESVRIGGPSESNQADVQGPAGLPQTVGSFVRADLSVIHPSYPSWAIPVRVYFRRTRDAWSLVGLERLPDGGSE